jgi:tyrosine-protein kinase Etk/Wzc
MSNQVSELPTVPPPAVATGGTTPTLLSELPLSSARRAWVEHLSILLLHKTLILSVTAVVTIIVGIYAFTAMPNYYKANSVVLPARRAGGTLDNITSGLANSLKDLGVAKVHGSADESYSPLSLMRSRELVESMVKRFNFVSIYRADNLTDAIDEFSQNMDGELTEEGNFLIAFEDTDPKRAATVANAIVDEINDVNSRLAKQEAVHNFSAAQIRYERNLADLDSAEKALGAFQRKYGVYSLPDQAKAELAALAELEQQKYSAQIQLQNAQQLYGANASEVTVFRNTLEQITSKLASMQTGLDEHASSFVPSNVMPDVALQYLRLTREIEIQSKLKGFLLPAYEQARLDQERNLYGFVVLDHAVPPVKKSRPHRSTLLFATILGTAVTTSLVILLLINIRRVRSNFLRDRRSIVF